MSAAFLRFVLLHHETDDSACPRPTHWDFMIELAGAEPSGALRTWALEQPFKAGSLIKATELPPHRIEYLDYEGPIHGDRGAVQRVDRGKYEIRQTEPDRLIIEIRGETLTGTVELKRQAGEEFVVSFEPTANAAD